MSRPRVKCPQVAKICVPERTVGMPNPKEVADVLIVKAGTLWAL